MPTGIWFWIAAALAVILAGAFVSFQYGVRRREETIRRQLARETALKARFDDLFERARRVEVGQAAPTP